jgi:hypothetical protein
VNRYESRVANPVYLGSALQMANSDLEFYHENRKSDFRFSW